MALTYAIGRRGALSLAGAAALAGKARAQNPSEVKIAMLVPLSGPWARSGLLEQMGARMAIDDVNAAGGIKALGGAKLKLMEFDCRRLRRKGQGRGATHGRAGARSGGRLRLLALQLHPGRDRGDRARRIALADAVLFRSDHRPRLQERVPVLAHRRRARRRNCCRSSWIWRPRRPASGRPRSAIVGSNNPAVRQLPEAHPRSRAARTWA